MNKKELILTAAFLFCFVSLGVCVGSLGPTLNSFTEHLDASVDQVGYFFSARGIGYFIGSLGCRFIDRFRNSNFLIAGATVVMGVGLLLAPVSGNIWLTAFIFGICGMGAGFIDSGLNTLIVWVWKDKVNPFMQLLHFSFGIGAFLAPLLVSQMVERSLFFQYLILAIIMLSSFFSIVFLKPAKHYVAEDIHSTENGELSKGEKRLRVEVILGIAIFLFFYVGAESGYGGWVCTYSIINLKFSDETGALLNSMFWGTFTLSRLGGVFLSLVLSPQKMVVLDTLGCFFFAILIIIFPGSPAILWIGTAGLGISLASIFPTAFSLPSNINIPITGEATSYMVIGAVIGEVVIPWSIGMFQHHVGMHTLPWVVLFSLIISLVIYIMINLRTIQVRARERGQNINFSFSNSIALLNQVVNSNTNSNNNNNSSDINKDNNLEAISSVNISINNIENKQTFII
ncbi:hypothetical protein DICPUDRAFT_40304 [Dictyostelium purpureum]|uniref:Major facilitator superfamily (MFS) profile domain-containing protein n=1 Tax=Dictyostelium purpureum TaxID=5786 RepID=F0ZY01_DICPU|nr:uncharacterized protein DICPUDRAFT_40304 [Dictyostelium purpureum]EGC31173.1 hypothetical protein DICPUDRAFT_40304 [Dictyostelium purpureum]|eukprot:XP_003292293.1 hypothetical protein DICPUDRAFT_40304 [Dictyostelium purpureum]